MEKRFTFRERPFLSIRSDGAERRRGRHAQNSLLTRRCNQSECRKGGHRVGWKSALLFASDHSFRSDLMEQKGVQVGTLKTPCSPEDVTNPNAVKVVTALDGKALYFSRATIPFDREGSGQARCYKHLGFYAYRKAALDAFCAWPESELERSERLEQLRFLDHGIAVHVAET